MSAEIFADPRALEAARRASLFILDVDGVLVDPRPSFYEAARETASWGAARLLGYPVAPPIADAEIRVFKEAGGWNDDFDLACACTWGLIVRAGTGGQMAVSAFARGVAGGPPALKRQIEAILPADLLGRAVEIIPTLLLRERAAVRYAGRARCLDLYGIEPDGFADLPVDGLWNTEPELASRATLGLLGGPFALFTGRNRGEAEMVLERFDLDIPDALLALDDGRLPRKPAPDALVHLAGQTQGPLVFIGDSIDDERAALAYQALGTFRPLPELVFVRIIEGDLDEPGSRARIVASSLDVFARTLRGEARELAE